MSRFVTSVSEDLEEECRAAMFHDNMDLGSLMVHAQQVEESRRRKRDRETKKSRPSDQSSSSNGNNLFGFRDRPNFMKWNKHLGNRTPYKNTNANEGNDRNA